MMVRIIRVNTVGKMWPDGTPDVVVGILKISLDRLKENKHKQFSRVLSCHVAVSSE